MIFAQVAQTESARAFWQGKLTKTKRASVISALLSEFDDRYQIYEDADDDRYGSFVRIGRPTRVSCAHRVSCRKLLLDELTHDGCDSATNDV